MAKVRIFQLAKELNLSHTDILNFLKARNIKVSSHMSPVDEATHKEIMNEFAKDKEQVDRYRKEQVRREIHDTKLRKQQESGKKLELLSLTKQRELEKKENQKALDEQKISRSKI